MSAPEKKRRIVRMSQLAEHGYDFSVKTCYGWCTQAVDPMPFIDMSQPGSKKTQYYVDLDELDAWLAKRRRGSAVTPAPVDTAPTRKGRRSRAAECESLGIEPDHTFA